MKYNITTAYNVLLDLLHMFFAPFMAQPHCLTLEDLVADDAFVLFVIALGKSPFQVRMIIYICFPSLPFLLDELGSYWGPLAATWFGSRVSRSICLRSFIFSEAWVAFADELG